MKPEQSEFTASAPTNPAGHAASITPADVDLSPVPRAVYVGTTGNLVVKTVDGTVVTFAGVPSGTMLPVRPIQIMALTTAANIVAVW